MVYIRPYSIQDIVEIADPGILHFRLNFLSCAADSGGSQLPKGLLLSALHSNDCNIVAAKCLVIKKKLAVLVFILFQQISFLK